MGVSPPRHQQQNITPRGDLKAINTDHVVRTVEGRLRVAVVIRLGLPPNVGQGVVHLLEVLPESVLTAASVGDSRSNILPQSLLRQCGLLHIIYETFGLSVIDCSQRH